MEIILIGGKARNGKDTFGGFMKEYYESLSEMDLKENPIPFIMLIEKRIINTMIEINRYLFVDEIDEKEDTNYYVAKK